MTDNFLNDHSHFFLFNPVIYHFDIPLGNRRIHGSINKLYGVHQLLKPDLGIGMVIGDQVGLKDPGKGWFNESSNNPEDRMARGLFIELMMFFISVSEYR